MADEEQAGPTPPREDRQPVPAASPARSLLVELGCLLGLLLGGNTALLILVPPDVPTPVMVLSVSVCSFVAWGAALWRFRRTRKRATSERKGWWVHALHLLMLLFLLAAYLYLHGSFDVKETDPKVDWRGIVGYDPTPKGSAYTVEHPNATTLDRVRAFGYHPDKAWTAKSILYATVLLCLALVLLIGFGVYLLMYYTEHIRFMRKELAA